MPAKKECKNWIARNIEEDTVYVVAADTRYEAEVAIGEATETDDALWRVVELPEITKTPKEIKGLIDVEDEA